MVMTRSWRNVRTAVALDESAVAGHRQHLDETHVLDVDADLLGEGDKREAFLAFVDPDESVAYFCADVSKATGDDWDHAPYQESAGIPTSWVYRFAWTNAFDFVHPADRPTGPYTVSQINAGAAPWLEYNNANMALWASATVHQFADFLKHCNSRPVRLGDGYIGKVDTSWYLDRVRLFKLLVESGISAEKARDRIDMVLGPYPWSGS